MKQKLTGRQIVEAWQPLQRLAREKMPVSAGWHLARITKVIQEQVQLLEEQRQPFWDTWNNAKSEPAKERAEAKLNDMWAELLKAEAELDFEPMPLETLPKKVEVAPADLMAMDFIFVVLAEAKEEEADDEPGPN